MCEREVEREGKAGRVEEMFPQANTHLLPGDRKRDVFVSANATPVT